MSPRAGPGSTLHRSKKRIARLAIVDPFPICCDKAASMPKGSAARSGHEFEEVTPDVRAPILVRGRLLFGRCVTSA
jgi:hypothetical protein